MKKLLLVILAIFAFTGMAHAQGAPLRIDGSTYVFFQGISSTTHAPIGGTLSTSSLSVVLHKHGAGTSTNHTCATLTCVADGKGGLEITLPSYEVDTPGPLYITMSYPTLETIPRVYTVMEQAGYDFLVGGDVATQSGIATAVTTAVFAQVCTAPTGIPAVSPTICQALSQLNNALRNKVTVTSAIKTFYDDAGAAIYTKALTDDGSTFTEAETAP